MTPPQGEAARAFKALHQAPHGFIMPNAWDAGSALILAAAGFQAIGTTSAGIAFSLGKQDYRVSDPRLAVTRDEMFSRARQIVDAVALPVNGDLEAGYGDSPQHVADCVLQAVEIGLAGCNIEDKPALEERLHDPMLAAERIAAARQALEAQGADLVLNARTDAWLVRGADPLAASIQRANLYLEAGADCVFIPGVIEPETVRILVREVAGPINLVLGLGNSQGNAGDLMAAGVQRISVGGALARSALGFLRRSAELLRDTGSVAFTEGEISGPDLNAIFAKTRVQG
ncbi:isocitrate lyase/phosphoenolpyruvate mutase family protein [Phenylobacterium sp.]|uniref:isocitrate lyase/PEP mutase family protein n=1 Tax=Phenylobacterium sp. TaxID=1871053 RepID=UPI00271993FC|nr:isocitrate lyase/phosphoenolpyruvate mutase family protein [Phenylobacterium sp.]MDO8378207.1 isocitrate lyase/phosphoenolpyruvate mutase family protein [Phenylobacterium sp.]